MTKKISLKNIIKFTILSFSMAFFCIANCIIFTGCSRIPTGYHIKSMPNKIVYQIGETPNFDGLKIEAINSDGTYHTFKVDKNDIQDVDTSNAGKKKVKIEKDTLALSFDIYVANVIVNDSDNLKEIVKNASNGDIIYLRQGQYKPQNNSDEKFKDIVVNKSLTFVGDGEKETKFFGNFVVGANFENGIWQKIENFEDVSFLRIGFELDFSIKNNFVEYNGPYGSTDTNGAIRCFDTKKLNVTNCNFVGYGYGILGDSVSELNVMNCTFKNIQKTAIKTTTDTKDTTIFKNIFMDIGTNIISFEQNQQSFVGAISLSFASSGQKGTSICKNVFSRIGIYSGEAVFFDQASKEALNSTQINVFKSMYINNSSSIALLSSAEDDLEIFGVVLTMNSYSGSLQNIFTGTKAKNTISQNGIIILD